MAQFQQSDNQATSDYLNGAIDLVSGWNFVSVPRRLAQGANTASIFTGIDSAGHSIWTYNQAEGGWKDLTSMKRYSPMKDTGCIPLPPVLSLTVL
jgi:hypothetical protein